MVMSAPSMPDDLQIVQPDSSLPKELAAFFGKWEGVILTGGGIQFFLIVEKIDEEKASLYTWRSDSGWIRYEGTVTKERGKYKIWFRGRFGVNEMTLRGNNLDLYVPPATTITLRRVS